MSKSAIVRGASKAASIWGKLDAAVKKQGGTEKALDILDAPDGASLIDAIADLLVQAELKTRDRFVVTVDFTKALDEMIAAGQYTYAHPFITAQNFSFQGSGVVKTEVILVHFDRKIESDDAVKELDRMGLRPATLQELCAFGEKYPDLQRQFPIVALGSVCVNPSSLRGVPCLGGWRARRLLYLLYWGAGWGSRCRFAAVRK